MSGNRRYRPPQPLPDDLALVLIDGDNLLHRVRGGRDEGAVRWLLPRLRAWRPSDVRIVLMLDGRPEPGESYRRQVVPGIESHHSGSLDGDTALIKLLGARPYEDRIRTVLITDDRALADRARHLHAFVRRLDWFVGQLAKAETGAPGSAGGSPAAARGAGSTRSRGPGAGVTGAGSGTSGRPTTVGAGRPPRRSAGMVGGDPSRESDGDPDRTPWKPGRGATRKRGNPKRGHPGT